MEAKLFKPTGKNIVRGRELSHLALSEAIYPVGLHMPKHEHELASISIVLRGGYRERYGRRVRDCRSSYVVFHPPTEVHEVNFGEAPSRILSVGLKWAWFHELLQDSLVVSEPVTVNGGLVSSLGRRLYGEFCRMDTFSPLAIEGLAMELLATFSRQVFQKEERAAPLLKRAEDFLQTNFCSAPTSGEVAAVVGVHPVHLARVFRAKHGCTVGEYLRRLRLNFAYEQISSTKNSLGQIALAAGFADQSHLTRSFKEHFGLTPSAYRRNLLSKIN